MASRAVKLDETLRALIDRGGYSRNRQAICRAVGISPAALSQYALGKTRPSFEKLVALAQFFGVSLDYLVFGELVSASIDSGPLARFFDQAVTEVRAQSSRHSDLVARIGRVLTDRIDVVARELASSPTAGREGMIEFDELFRVERYCLGADFVTTSLEADVISTELGPEPGQFLELVAANLMKERGYRFLLVGDPASYHSSVAHFRQLLQAHGADEAARAKCEFRTTQAPVFAFIGLYRLDLSAFELEEPALATQCSKYVDPDRRLGFVDRPNNETRGAMLMSLAHARLAHEAFEELWSDAPAV